MSNSLSSKLKTLGVKVGARETTPQPAEKEKRLHRYAVENVMAGRVIGNEDGACFVVERDFAADYHHGRTQVHASFTLNTLARWARDERMAGCARECLVFLDTETTGLAGGTGTLPFMIGVGRYTAGAFKVAQFFMRDPAEEAALLTALREWLEPCETLVTFNGKAFDMPIVASRYTMHRRAVPLARTAHLDLLPLARRLWRDRLASRALGSLEQHILGATRTHQDVPGWLIPSLYFDYLRSGDARRLSGVFYHNAMDIVAMAALLAHVAQMLDRPLDFAVQHPIDYVSLGKLFEELGDHELAADAYGRGLAGALPPAAYSEASRRLSYLQRKRGQHEQALAIWREASEHGEVYAHVALAKYYEHRVRDYENAERMTLEAIRLVSAASFPSQERRKVLPDLQRRLDRIWRKQSAVGKG